MHLHLHVLIDHYFNELRKLCKYSFHIYTVDMIDLGLFFSKNRYPKSWKGSS